MTAQTIQPPGKYKLTVADFVTLDEQGVFEAYAKSELIEGEIVVMNAQHRPHARIKMALYDSVRDALKASGSALTAFVEASFEAPPHNLPEPDIMLTSEPEGDGFVPLHSVALVIEVADSSLRNDLTVKAALYAQLDLPEYWVVDVKGRVIHQMWAPGDDGYGERRDVAFGASIEPATVTALRLSTEGL